MLLLDHKGGCEGWVCSRDRGTYRSVCMEAISSIWPAPPPEEVLGKSAIWPRYDHIDSRSTEEDPGHRGRYAAERRYVSLTISTPYRPKTSIVTLPNGGDACTCILYASWSVKVQICGEAELRRNFLVDK
jgi:hypothetical protein